jgi:tocopherol O-methyltransferase
MITPRVAQTLDAVATHYDELDPFYREIWGEHVHHGLWATGLETPREATDALVDHVADQLALTAGMKVIDIGCGYGAAARRIATRHGVDVTGVTVSAVQAAHAPDIARHMDWLGNDFPDAAFAAAYAIESSEHMVDKQRCFDEARRVLRPGGRLVVCAWLAGDAPSGWQVRHLLEPICREGRLPGMGNEDDYRHFAEQAGFQVRMVEDVSHAVRRTWIICARRIAGRLITDRRYVAFLLNARAKNRIFLLTLVRLIAAYRTGAMRYCVLVLERP